jgi:LysM repeat protein
MPNRNDNDYSEGERARIRELKAQGYTGGGIKVRMRIEREENYKQQVQQATALNPTGRPNAAPVIQPQQPTEYTWSDGDTLPGVAQQFNTTPADLLQANPDMTAPQTGMVINTQPVYPVRKTSEYGHFLWMTWLKQGSSVLPPGYVEDYNRQQNKKWLNGIAPWLQP